MSDLALAIYEITLGRAERIAAPGQWRVWRENGRVRFEILSKE